MFWHSLVWSTTKSTWSNVNRASKPVTHTNQNQKLILRFWNALSVLQQTQPNIQICKWPVTKKHVQINTESYADFMATLNAVYLQWETPWMCQCDTERLIKIIAHAIFSGLREDIDYMSGAAHNWQMQLRWNGKWWWHFCSAKTHWRRFTFTVHEHIKKTGLVVTPYTPVYFFRPGNFCMNTDSITVFAKKTHIWPFRLLLSRKYSLLNAYSGACCHNGNIQIFGTDFGGKWKILKI